MKNTQLMDVSMFYMLQITTSLGIEMLSHNLPHANKLACCVLCIAN